MQTAASSFEKERREVEAILASGIFNRAPNIAHLLSYICGRYFEGAASEIKEYSIAVDAFKRPPEFDQKRDSIVRVEAHRLRKRLREYYENEGAGHAVHIDIPSGQYSPRFVFTAQTESPATLSTEVTVTALAPGYPPVDRSRFLLLGIPAILLAALLIFIVTTEHRSPQPRIPEVAFSSDPRDEVRILAGLENGSYVDSFEHTWLSDRDFSGGYVARNARAHPVSNTRDQRMYQTRREGAFKYDIPLKAGTYELKLYFAETVFGDNNVAGGGETTRLFLVAANGKTLMQGLDVIGDAGPGVADVKVFKDIAPARDGKLHLEFLPQTNAAFVNAIEVLPALPGLIRPIRIVARDRGLKDSQNRYWDPDRYAQGGQIISRPESNVKGGDAELYRSERFGNITYTLPVPQSGRYEVNLYFSENWFGTGMPGGGGIGSRTFDILINGVALRRNFDILRDAGANGATTVSVHNIQANHQGKIVISLTPAINYAVINALEILDETRS